MMRSEVYRCSGCGREYRRRGPNQVRCGACAIMHKRESRAHAQRGVLSMGAVSPYVCTRCWAPLPSLHDCLHCGGCPRCGGREIYDASYPGAVCLICGGVRVEPWPTEDGLIASPVTEGEPTGEVRPCATPGCGADISGRNTQARYCYACAAERGRMMDRTAKDARRARRQAAR